ncbi:MAG: DUF4339 domain-containing protein [Pseudobacter sp.]|uniref:DUF4339 domain-containing protein n=1 Tax=Pseudobacter sp. TaxID=2045420 RepID=UPI003F81901C
MKKYYTHDGVQQHGPFSIPELQVLNLRPESYIWHEGLSDWQLAGSVEELKAIFNSHPPPFRNSSVQSPPSLETLKQSSAYRSGKRAGKLLIIISAILLLTWGGRYIYARVEEQQMKNHIKKNISQYVQAGNSAYKYSLLGGISGLKMTLSNNTQYVLEEVKVRLDYHKPDGTIWDHKIIVFTYVAPFEEAVLPVEDTNRGVKISYQIHSVKSVELGL